MSIEAERPQASSEPAIAAWRPSTLTVFGIWCIAATGFVAVSGVTSTPGWWWVTSFSIGVAWVWMVIGYSRPFIEIRRDGCTYRAYGRAMHVPWSDVECVDMSPPAERPRVMVLQRSPEVLVTIDVLAAGWTTSRRRKRVRSIVDAAAPFVATHIPARSSKYRAEPSVSLSSRPWSWLVDVLWLLLGIAVAVMLGVAGLSGPSRSANVFAVFGFAICGGSWRQVNQRTAATWPARSVRFDATGVAFEFRRWPRRSAIRYASSDIARIVVLRGRFLPQLAIVLSNNSVISLRRDLVDGRDAASLTLLAKQLDALIASSAR